ncbi:MAG: hypothetical protein ACLQBB_06255 [Solirubrobacteraceae bacterium]
MLRELLIGSWLLGQARLLGERLLGRGHLIGGLVDGGRLRRRLVACRRSSAGAGCAPTLAFGAVLFAFLGGPFGP